VKIKKIKPEKAAKTNEYDSTNGRIVMVNFTKFSWRENITEEGLEIFFKKFAKLTKVLNVKISSRIPVLTDQLLSTSTVNALL